MRITSVGPEQSDVWFTTRYAGKREVGDGSFQKPGPWRLAISSEPAPTGTHTLDAGTNTPCFRQRPQNLSRKADLCGGSASQPSVPPNTTSPQHCGACRGVCSFRGTGGVPAERWRRIASSVWKLLKTIPSTVTVSTGGRAKELGASGVPLSGPEPNGSVTASLRVRLRGGAAGSAAAERDPSSSCSAASVATTRRPRSQPEAQEPSSRSPSATTGVVGRVGGVGYVEPAEAAAIPSARRSHALARSGAANTCSADITAASQGTRVRTPRHKSS